MVTSHPRNKRGAPAVPGLGEPDEPMLEAYTALGALATATENIQLSALVTGNT